MKKTNIFTTFLLLLLCIFSSVAQESLKSTEEEYYNFLSLTGTVNRPTLNYRTLSDSVWTFNDQSTTNHVWQNNNLGSIFTLFTPETESTNRFVKGLKQGLFLKVYGPEWFNSFNTAAPYGQNDGALWQGKGYNTSLTTGLRLEGYGFEVTFKPQLTFSQNLVFDYITPAYTGDSYTGKADTYGYYGIKYIDAPQRFGNEAFFTFDWGDTELRYTWNTLTIGFGTQAIWLGPAQLNPILHSNNAPSYPKVDIGLRRQPITLPWLDWYIGDIEGRAWWGQLNESDFFDNNFTNNSNLITGLSLAYAFPGIFNGLTMGVNRTMMSKWDDMNYKALFTLLNPFIDNDAGFDENDQRASITIDYLLPEIGLELYYEYAINDYLPNYNFVLQWPFHAIAYTFGVQKDLKISNSLHGKLLLEVSNLECSRDYGTMISWNTTFYSHSIITQGYTNKGQWLGSGIGTGGNSQYIGFKLYSNNWFADFFIQRRNPDMDYSWYIDSVKNEDYDSHDNVRVILTFGVSGGIFVQKNKVITSSVIYNYEQNPTNISNPNRTPIVRNNFCIHIGLQYNF